jgi:hypothetical protein
MVVCGAPLIGPSGAPQWASYTCQCLSNLGKTLKFRNRLHLYPSFMFETFKRLFRFEPNFGTTIKLSSFWHEPIEVTRLPLVAIRTRMLEMAKDCDHNRAHERLHFALQAAKAPNDLWQLRSELYNLLATEFGQNEASKRVNLLLPAFEGWIAPHRLTQVR